MLDAMRATAKSFVMKIILLLLVVSFAVWGVGDVVRSGNSGHVAKVGDETVSYADFARRSALMERMMQSMGITSVDRRAVEDQVLRQLVEEKLVALRLKEIGVSPNTQLLAGRLKASPLFHDVRGKFDPELFRTTLAQRQMNEATFLEELRADIRAQAFTASLGTETVNPPAALLALEAISAAERRNAQVVTITSAGLKIDAPSEDALKDYYERNKDTRYLAPETRTLEFVTFPASALEKLAAEHVSNDDVAAHYEAEKDRLASATEARKELESQAMETVLEDVSIKIEDALAGGSAMGEAVAAAGLNAQSNLLKDVTTEQAAAEKRPLNRSVIERGFALEEGETSTLDVTADGAYYLVALQAIEPASPQPYDAVKADVASRMAELERNRALRARATEVKEALGADDKEALAKLGVSPRDVRGIRRPAAGATPGVPALLAQAVFEHRVGGVAGPLMENGSAVVARVTAIEHPATAPAADAKTLEAARKQVSSEVLNGYYRTLTTRYPVKINQPLLEQLRAQEQGA